LKRKNVFFEAGILLLSLLLLPGLVGCGVNLDLKATTTPTPTSTPPITPTPTYFAIQRAQVLDFITSLSTASVFRIPLYPFISNEKDCQKSSPINFSQ
jgi:hypothetical protein